MPDPTATPADPTPEEIARVHAFDRLVAERQRAEQQAADERRRRERVDQITAIQGGLIQEVTVEVDGEDIIGVTLRLHDGQRLNVHGYEGDDLLVYVEAGA